MAVDPTRINQTSPMGANLMPSGTGFRTWAPNARMVSVIAGAALEAAGPGFSPAASDNMVPLSDGTWGGFLAGLGEGDVYMFFIEGVGSSGWKRDSFARELTLTPAFPTCYCVVRDPACYPWHDAGWQTPQFSDMIIYQLHIGTWWAQDSAGNDARATQSGTFLDAVEKIGYLQALGINVVQLLPIQEFESPYSMGYNGVDYFSPEGEYVVGPADLAWRVDPINQMLASFGKPPMTESQLQPGINQLKCFVDLCHLHGIAVVFDLVYNHGGPNFDDQSLWFYDRQANGNQNNSLYFTDQSFGGGQVFAYWNSWVAEFIINNACFFLQEYRIDGIRYDEVRAFEDYGGRDVCQNLTQTVRATNPSALQNAEYWNPNRPSAVEAPPAGLGFDVELGDGLRDALRGLVSQASGGESVSLDLSGVAGTLVTPAGFSDGWRIVQFIENQDITYAGHDGAARVVSLADPSNHRSWYACSRSRVATSLVLAAPGIPVLFMGEEFLEDKLWSDNRGYNGLIWWEGLAAADSSMRDFLRFTTDLIGVRHSQPALRASGVRVSRAANFDRVIVLHRWVEGQGNDLVVVASFDELPKSGYAVGLPYAGGWREVFNSDYYNDFPNPAVVGNGGSVQASGPPMDGFTASAVLTLPPNGVIMLTME